MIGVSRYLDLLPAIYREQPFLGTFLLAFEQVFSGVPGSNVASPPGLEQTVAAIAQLFDPQRQQQFLEHLRATDETRQGFLTWLSGWVALGLRADLTAEKQRDFLAQIVGLYRRRGTKENLQQLLKIYTDRTPLITDGDDLPVGERNPHHFHVTIHMDPVRAELERVDLIARALIELQKPAHTTYTLEFVFTTMQIRIRSQVGVNTMLGQLPSA